MRATCYPFDVEIFFLLLTEFCKKTKILSFFAGFILKGSGEVCSCEEVKTGILYTEKIKLISLFFSCN